MTNKMLANDFFKLGSTLEQVEVDVIESDNQVIISHWYHSEYDADVVLWLDKKSNILKQQVSVYGQFVQWDLITGLKTGYIHEEENSAIKNELSTRKLIYDKELSQAAISNALDLLSEARHLDLELLKSLEVNIKSNPCIENVDKKTFLTNYDHFSASSPVKVEKLGFLQRIIRKIKQFF